VNRFSYLDLILADTPIADIDVALDIRRKLSSRVLVVRFERTQLFIDYLKKREEKEFINNPANQFSDLGKYRFSKKINSSFLREKRVYPPEN
jgi:hypothetical protein